MLLLLTPPLASTEAQSGPPRRFPSKKVVLVALGERRDGSRELLDFMLMPSESESAWWGFVSDLEARGLGGGDHPVVRVGGMVTDEQAGLVRAITAWYPRVEQPALAGAGLWPMPGGSSRQPRRRKHDWPAAGGGLTRA